MFYPRKRWLRSIIYFVCFILVLMALDMLWARERRVIHPRYDTTRITEPRMDDGSIDYLGAVEVYFSRGVTPENNCAPLLLEALGRIALPKTQPPDGITSRLGMSPLPEKGDYYVTYSNFVKARTGKPADLHQQTSDILSSDLAAAPLEPEVAQWIAGNDKPLEKIRQASMRSRYFIPFNGGNRPDMLVSVLLPHVSPLRDVSRALSLRARSRAGGGDFAGAREDCMTLHRLARLFGAAPTLVERLVAIAMETEACNADRSICGNGKMSAKELGEFGEQLFKLPDLDEPSPAIDCGERYMILDATQHLARLNPMDAGRLFNAVSNDGAAPPPALFPLLPIPYEGSMIEANKWYDSMLAALRQPTYALQHDALDRWNFAAQSLPAHSVIAYCTPEWGLRVFLPNLMRFQIRWETARAQKRLTQAAVLLARYKAEHQQYPKALDELETEYKVSLPLDNFTDRPLIYSRSANGYTLYSPGPNMIDDGGKNDDVIASSK